MIRVSVMYNNEPGRKFDWDYYLNEHLVMVQQRLEPWGLVRTEVDKAADPASPFIAVGYMYFNSVEDFHKGFFDPDNGAAIAGDVVNYTDTSAQMQISEIVK